MICFFLVCSGAHLCHSACAALLGLPFQTGPSVIPCSLRTRVRAPWKCSQHPQSPEAVVSPTALTALTAPSCPVSRWHHRNTARLAQILHQGISPQRLPSEGASGQDLSERTGPGVTHKNRTQWGILSTWESQDPKLRKAHSVYGPPRH